MDNKRIFVLILCFSLLIAVASASSADEIIIELTEEERVFIEEHPIISLGVDPTFVPFEFIDIDGQHKGIARDYINLLSERIGIQMVVTENLTWSEAYELAVEKKIDVLPCVSLTKERKRYFNFSEPYYYFQRVIIIKNSNNLIKGYEDLKGIYVAVHENSSHHSYLKEYSEININLYNTVEQGLMAVSEGTEVAFVGNLATSSHMIKSLGLTDLKYIAFEAKSKKSLHFAVRDDWPELVSIIDKGLAIITDEEKIEINNRWIGFENEIDYSGIIRVALFIGIVILLIMLVSFFWISKLKKEVEKRILIEEDLLLAKYEAESANRIKSSFLARMSHEIRTPLNAITGMAYLIKKTDVTITQKMHLEKITQASGNMLSIINDILDFSKIEAGKIEIENISFDLDKVIQSVINIVSFKVEEQGIGFSLIKEPKLPNIFFGDPKRIEQILLNIINNAVKFTNEGEVSLGIRLIANQGNKYHIEFRIKDTGIGMSEEHLEQLFEPFSQEDSSINRRFGGTGLGLSIVKSLIEMMNGKIEVYSTIGEGSIFIIKLVFESDIKKEKAAAVYFQDIKTIILDKTVVNLNKIGSYVESFAIDAELITSSSLVIEMLEENSRKYIKAYDLLILDYDTPDGGGFEFIKKIKMNDKILKKPKIIVIFPFMREDLFEHIDDIDIGISKPIIPSVLYNGILELFKTRAFSSKVLDEDSKYKESGVTSKTYYALVVEDNKTNQFIAKSILEEVGFIVLLADNGEIGVSKFKENQEKLDIILMDLHMPVMNGYDATTLIRDMDDKIPIVAMTADAVTGVEEKCRQYGIDFYISKPFEPELFIDRLIQIIEEKKYTKQNLENGKLHSDNKNYQVGVLDEEDGLMHLANNQELYNAVLKEYLKENMNTTSNLTEVIKIQNFPEAIQIVHKIKSSSASIGAKHLYEVATALQKALESNDLLNIAKLHLEFNSTLTQLIEEIERRK